MTKPRIYDMRSKPGNLELSARFLGNIHALEVQNRSWQLAKRKYPEWTDKDYAQWVANNWNATDPATGASSIRVSSGLQIRRPEINELSSMQTPRGTRTNVKNLDYAKSQGWIYQTKHGSFAVREP